MFKQSIAVKNLVSRYYGQLVLFLLVSGVVRAIMFELSLFRVPLIVEDNDNSSYSYISAGSWHNVSGLQMIRRLGILCADQYRSAQMLRKLRLAR
jgi:hypothetical protein